MSTSKLVQVGRRRVTINLFDTEGGVVELYTSLTGDQSSAIASKYEGKTDTASRLESARDTIAACLISWNIGHEGAELPLVAESLRQFSQRDILAMLQACTGTKLLDNEGNFLTDSEISKKG